MSVTSSASQALAPQVGEAAAEWANLADLIEWEANPKDHSGEHVDKIRASIDAFGWLTPIVANRRTKTIVAGHGRRLAAIARGDVVVPVRFVELSDADAELAALADNRLNELSGYDDSKLAALLRRHADDDRVRLAVAGYVERDVARALRSAQRIEDQRVNAHERGAFEVFARDRVIDETLDYFKARAFPYADMPLHTQMQEINALAALDLASAQTSPRANRVADIYNPHRFATKAQGKLSPTEAFADEKVLRHAIEMSVDAGSTIGAGYFGALAFSRGTQACGNFRPGYASYIYRRFGVKGGVVLDPSIGFGGRLVGWLASLLGGTYVGTDPNTLSHAGAVRMMRALAPDASVDLICAPFEEADLSAVSPSGVDLVFTSPPYFAKEMYSDEETQSYKKFPTYEEWRDGFLSQLLQRSFDALKDDRYCVINIADVTLGGKTYPLEADTVDAAKRAGFKHVETLHFGLSRVPGQGEQQDAFESVFVFRKGGADVDEPDDKHSPSRKDGFPAVIEARSTSGEYFGDKLVLPPGVPPLARIDGDTVLPAPRIDDVAGFHILRDDIVHGGSKRRALPRLLTKRCEYVYASAAQGFAQLALALAARDAGCTATIFVAKSKQPTAVTLEALRAGATIYQVPMGFLSHVTAKAKAYARAHDAQLVPFGLDAPEFTDAFVELAQSLPITPSEVWTVVGSGTLTRALQRAWPSADFHAVRCGSTTSSIGRAREYKAPEKFADRAKQPPPFASCITYDAKAWQFMKKSASPGAFFWNVAA